MVSVSLKNCTGEKSTFCFLYETNDFQKPRLAAEDSISCLAGLF